MKSYLSSFSLIPIFLLLTSLLGIPYQNIRRAPDRPNILLIYVDDLNDRLGCYGDSLAQTPHIDQLSASGTHFQRAYCQQALCNPSRASMLTGMRPSTLGINSLKGNLLEQHPDLKTLPRLFREAGYFTARAGKVFHMGVPDAIAMGHSGKDDPLAWDEAINCPAYELNNNGVYQNATPWETHRVGAGGAISWLRAEKGDNRHHDYNVATEIIALMQTNRRQPFFLAAGFIRPHVPFIAPKRFFERFDSVEISLPEVVPEDRADMPYPAYDTWAADFGIPPANHLEALRAYYTCVSFVDEQVGRLMDALEDSGLADETIVVFVSDHGYQLGEHGLWFKNFLFRESAIAPLIIRVPGSVPQRIGRPVELLDVLPTLLDLTGQRIPESAEGHSLLPLIEGKHADWPPVAFVETVHKGIPGKAAYTKNWSYMRWGNGEAGEELYHLTDDPGQLHNLANQSRYRDTLAHLRGEISRVFDHQ